MREGYHLLPLNLRVERDRLIVILFDRGVVCKQIVAQVNLGYEGVRVVLRRHHRMGKT